MALYQTGILRQRFSKLKQWCAIGMHTENVGRNYYAAISQATTLIWPVRPGEINPT